MRRILLVLVVAAMMVVMMAPPVFAQTTSDPQFYCIQGPGGSCNGGPVDQVPDVPQDSGYIPLVEGTLDVWGDVADVVEDLYPRTEWWEPAYSDFLNAHYAYPDWACYWWGDGTWGCVPPS